LNDHRDLVSDCGGRGRRFPKIMEDGISVVMIK
jgi:hypothetical protein